MHDNAEARLVPCRDGMLPVEMLHPLNCPESVVKLTEPGRDHRNTVIESANRDLRGRQILTLRKMTEDEFRAFRKTSTADYAVDLMKGRNIGPEQALMEA